MAATFGVVPVEGVTQTSLLNSLSCPTIAKRPIEFQSVFLRLSHQNFPIDHWTR